MGSFGVVFFFAVTGLTLNHPQWFAHQQRTANVKGAINTAWTKTATDADVKKLEIVEYLRTTHGIHGALSDFRIDDRECDVSFKGPGYSADVFIDRTSGTYDLTENRMGFAAIINDLHKGRDSGDAWKWLIDLSAVLLVFVSLTGLVLIWFVHKHRVAGLLSLAAGSLITYLIFLLWVE
ncbi:MAG: PepSY-associated TM helix domain-containing protein [Acidobacteria bacterium]|nr:PepSY-associated TM helix domain-containing protein [Acidobacteriota bacterium]MBP8275249.1 PepSY-associated TM helix domain-containing protein [Acidobacteriota bacterium]